MKYRLSLFLFVLLMGASYAAKAQSPDPLPTPSFSDFVSDVPPEWISVQLKEGRWKYLVEHVCSAEQADANGLAIKKRLMDIFSWKTFVALSWPTANQVDQRAFGESWYAEGSGNSLSDSIRVALTKLSQSSEDDVKEGDVQVELLSKSPQYTVGVTRCEKDKAKWKPLDGSVWAVSNTAVFPSENQIAATNCPRWMTWQTLQDVVGPQGVMPRVTHRSFCEDDPQARHNFLSILTLSDFDHLTDVDVPGVQYPLIDQNGNKVFYDVAMNFVSYCTLKRIALHAHDESPPLLTFPTGESSRDVGELPGSTELKFAWKVLIPGKEDPKRFITRKVSIPDDTDPKSLGKDCFADPMQCTWKDAEVGLAGMHIVHRSKDHTSWIWSTFEQIDNAPDEDSSKTELIGGRTFSFYGDAPARLHNTIGAAQITRTQKIAPDTARLNAEVQQLLQGQHSILQYYELVGTQYDVCNTTEVIKKAVPHFLRNTVIEPYLPDSSSCIGCHSGAQLSQTCCSDPKGCGADFSFIARGLICSSTIAHPSSLSGTASHK